MQIKKERIAWVVFWKKKNFFEILNLFKNANAWKEIASPPKEIRKQQRAVFIDKDKDVVERSKQPFVISKKPERSPFETGKSTPIFDKSEEIGRKKPIEERTSVITKKIAIYPPINKTELIPENIVSPSKSVDSSFFWQCFDSISFGEYFR